MPAFMRLIVLAPVFVTNALVLGSLLPGFSMTVADRALTREQYWESGLGMVMMASALLAIAGLIMVLRKSRHAIPALLLLWVMISVLSAIPVFDIIRGGEHFLGLAAANVAGLALVAGYLSFSKEVRAYFGRCACDRS